ncbi:MAG: hypothetical protein ACKO23_02490 [Gemmataceae bacterium]
MTPVHTSRPWKKTAARFPAVKMAAPSASVESALRDIAYVLHLSRRVQAEMTAAK